MRWSSTRGRTAAGNAAGQNMHAGRQNMHAGRQNMPAATLNIPTAARNIPTGPPYSIPALIDMLTGQPAHNVPCADMSIKAGRILFMSEERGAESAGGQIQQGPGRVPRSVINFAPGQRNRAPPMLRNFSPLTQDLELRAGMNGAQVRWRKGFRELDIGAANDISRVRKMLLVEAFCQKYDVNKEDL